MENLELRKLAEELKAETADTTKKWSVKIESGMFSYNDITFPINFEAIKCQVLNTKYPTSQSGWTRDAHIYNPLEADRSKNRSYWKEEYLPFKNGKVHLKFPLFNRAFWFLFAQLGRIPTFDEFARAYLFAYTKVCILRGSNSIVYSDGRDHCNLKLDETIYINGYTFTNKTLQFIDKKNVHLPMNFFTTEQILYRLCKIYGSLIRDLYHPIAFSALGAEVLYDSTIDIQGGIDMIVNKALCCAYVSTKTAENFAKDKQSFRHSDLVLKDEMGDPIACQILTDVYGKDGIVVPKDEVLQRIINDIHNDTLHEIYRY